MVSTPDREDFLARSEELLSRAGRTTDMAERSRLIDEGSLAPVRG